MTDPIPLEPCRPGCKQRCACNRRALRALLASIGLLADRDTVSPPAKSQARDAAAWRTRARPIEPALPRPAPAHGRASRG